MKKNVYTAPVYELEMLLAEDILTASVASVIDLDNDILLSVTWNGTNTWS